MKKLYILLTLLCVQSAGWAQSTDDREAVKAVIQTLFDGMLQADSSKVHRVFTKSVTMATVVRDKTGNPVLRQESELDGFLKAVGGSQPNKLAEEIWNVVVQVDGDFAQAWCDYAFYADHTFSHCGVDAFHLHKTKEGWKIFHLADTRRKEGCQPPAAIQAKHKK